ncbi:uncharacterized protein LOC125856017 [Solanum stenotomum]|uniref:uncharacterized protein LOC125856017 n=1 Tax=Solanum stenotomum TaxID=172797 RepID=UPI0020D018BB|nr:uncharacterized protein LOC125856017 [Solanum stenotomum]
MTNEDVTTAFVTLDQAMKAQANRDVGTRVNANESIVASRLRDFVRMNPPVFLGSRVGENPQEFLDEVYKIVNAIVVSSREKAELVSYQLKKVVQVWLTQWKNNRPFEAGPIEWEELKGAFLCRYLPREKRECKVAEFINLKQSSMIVEEYSLKFTLLSKYAPSLVSNPRDEMIRYVTGISDLVEEECLTAMLHNDMDISRLMVYAQSIEESKLKRKSRELKKGRSDEQGQPRFNCGKRHHEKCLAGTSGCYGCGKHDHQVRNCPTLTTRGREAKQASYVGPDPNSPKKNHFYALEAYKDKKANPEKGTNKF